MLQVASEGVQGRLGERHGAAAAGGLGAPHAQHPVVQVNVVQLQGKQLTLSHPGVDGEHVENFKTVPARRFEEGACLLMDRGVTSFFGTRGGSTASATLRVTSPT